MFVRKGFNALTIVDLPVLSLSAASPPDSYPRDYAGSIFAWSAEFIYVFILPSSSCLMGLFATWLRRWELVYDDDVVVGGRCLRALGKFFGEFSNVCSKQVRYFSSPKVHVITPDLI